MVKFQKARSVKKRATFRRGEGKRGEIDRIHTKIAKGNRQSQQKGYVQ